MPDKAWRYEHLDLNEASLPDGRTIRRPVGVGGAYTKVPVVVGDLELRSPPGQPSDTVAWQLQLGARRAWRLPFTVLFGQLGWFDRFPTTIEVSATVVELVPRKPIAG